MTRPKHHPLITVKLFINSSLCSAIVDSGCNASCISDKLMKDLKLNLIHLDRTVTFKTPNNIIKCLDRVTCEVTIGYKTLKTQLYVLYALNHPIIFGLDLIKMFSLEISPTLQIFQHIHLNGVVCKEEINTNEDHSPNTNLVNTLSTPITNTHLSKINKLVQDFQTIFALNKYDVGLISSTRCMIELNSNTPINLRPYRCNPKDRKLLEDQIQSLLDKNLIQKSTSQYAFPVTMVKKKDADTKERLCVDFRKLNAVTIADNHPFPRIEDIVDHLRDSEVFTVLDMNSGFWQIRVLFRDIYKTAFVTQTDYYEWLVRFKECPCDFLEDGQ